MLTIVTALSRPAFANQPYVAGYPQINGGNNLVFTLQIYYWENYTGTDTTKLTNWIGPTESIAGAKLVNGCCEASSGYVYQGGTAVTSSSYNPPSSVLSAPQIWYCSGTSCGTGPVWAPTPVNLGSPSSINYVYQTIFFNPSNSQQIEFYYEVHFKSGSITSQTFIYTESGGNSDNDFQVGTVSSSVGLEKHFQVGVESPTVNQNWQIGYNIAPYYVGWVLSGQVLQNWGDSGIAAYATQGSTAWITDDGSTSGHVYCVGCTNYSGANAVYHNNNNAFPRGKVNWYYSGTTISEGTQFWPTS